MANGKELYAKHIGRDRSSVSTGAEFLIAPRAIPARIKVEPRHERPSESGRRENIEKLCN